MGLRTDTESASACVAPFLKWAGGKSRLVHLIRPHLGRKGRKLVKLVEPFAGSAAVTLALHSESKHLWINDGNPDLVNVFEQIKAGLPKLERCVEAYFTPENNSEVRFYELRERFNTKRRQTADRAALFLYLNKHGYNGLCRYNASGAYNVPFGRYKTVPKPGPRLRACAAVLKRCRVTSSDFETVLDECGRGAAVYCDPPYVPLSSSAKFNAYAKGGFSAADQARLVAAAKRAAARGAIVVISNHDTRESRALYADAVIHELSVRRHISSAVATRGHAKEIIAVYGG